MKRKPLNRLLKENIRRYGMVLDSTMFINNVLRTKGTKYCLGFLTNKGPIVNDISFVTLTFLQFVFIDEIGTKYNTVSLSKYVCRNGLYTPELILKNGALMKTIINNQNVDRMDLVMQQIPILPQSITPNQ